MMDVSETNNNDGKVFRNLDHRCKAKDDFIWILKLKFLSTFEWLPYPLSKSIKHCNQNINIKE